MTSAKEKEYCITKRGILSSLAFCAVESSPYDFPPNLQEALDVAVAMIDASGTYKDNRKGSSGQYIMLKEEAVKSLVHSLVFDVPQIALWNVTKREQDAGITDPEDPRRIGRFSFTSAYDSVGDPDDEFVDLHALERNMLGMLLVSQD